MKHQKKTKTFSKSILVFDYAIAVILVAVAVWYSIKTESYSNSIASMVDVWIAQAGVVTAFYLWKSKCENRAKYAQEWYERVLHDESLPPEKLDAAIRAAEMITRD